MATDLVAVEIDDQIIMVRPGRFERAYLQKLHVFKTTADFAAGKKLYDDICTVGEDMAKYREVVMRKKLPRKQFVQANTVLKEGKVELVEYEATTEGIIKSFVERRV